MLKKIVLLSCFLIVYIIFLLVIEYQLPDARYMLLTDREMLLLNPAAGESTALFHLRPGYYLLTFHVDSNDQSAISDEIGIIAVPRGGALIALYSEVKQDQLYFSVRTDALEKSHFYAVPFAAEMAFNWRVPEYLFRQLMVDKPQVLITYEVGETHTIFIEISRIVDKYMVN